MPHTIAIVGTLDTKGKELEYLKKLIEDQGCDTIVVDVGVFPQSFVHAEIGRDEVALKGGSSVSEILERQDRKFAIQTMMQGGSQVLRSLNDEGRFSAIISIGGGTGTHIATAIMRTLPIGIPKLMVSTVASRDMSGIIGSKDITLMHAVSDIVGLNFLTRKLLADAARAITGMVYNSLAPDPNKLVIGLTSYGPLNQCAFAATVSLEQLGYEVVPFHAVGTGSMAMEDLVDQGIVHGVLDLALHEFADELYGGYCKYIGPGRLETAGRKGVPHVILPGGLDMIAFECASLEGFPAELRNRRFLSHDFRSFVRTSAQDLFTLAEVISGKLRRAKHPPTIMIPLKGWSKADSPGGPFYDPETNQVFVSRLKEQLSGSHVRILEVDANINDPECSAMAVSELHRLMRVRVQP
ncbi:MAG: Tm-1-like ATP-binding domain-containing protein [Desulfomonile sp.]